MDGVLIWFSIVFCAIGITTLFFGLCERRKVIHEHICKYKLSKDYAHLWDLIHEGNRVIYLITKDDAIDWGGVMRIYKYSYDNKECVFGLGLSSWEQENITKEEFVGLCQYKNIVFLDFADEVKE